LPRALPIGIQSLPEVRICWAGSVGSTELVNSICVGVVL
jgi:hypothetical protein